MANVIQFPKTGPGREPNSDEVEYVRKLSDEHLIAMCKAMNDEMARRVEEGTNGNRKST